MASGELFGTDDAARGYASARPPVHPVVVRLAAQLIALPELVDVALDVGCGAGLSTRRSSIGPSIPCRPWCSGSATVAPGALGVVGRAEALPVADASVDLVTAAGSLDFVDDLDAAVAEIARVLAPGGVALVYDFTTGGCLRARPRPWFAEVLRAGPAPATARRSTAAALAGSPAWLSSATPSRSMSP